MLNRDVSVGIHGFAAEADSAISEVSVDVTPKSQGSPKEGGAGSARPQVQTYFVAGATGAGTAGAVEGAATAATDAGAARRRRARRRGAPARARTDITDAQGTKIGEITSGGFGPRANGPVAMGYVDGAWAAPGTTLVAIVRGKPVPMEVSAMPFVPTRYYRG